MLRQYTGIRCRHYGLDRETRWTGGVINMLIFYCNYCNEMLTGGDYESTDQIVDRLDEHTKKCPPAAFTFGGTTGAATQRLDALRSFHEGERRAGKIRLH
jgi:hypothetical protein